jgi:hypothetical protein
MEDEELFGMWDGQCQACEMWGRVNDLGLCEECDGKIQRDLIRARDWDYVAGPPLGWTTKAVSGCGPRSSVNMGQETSSSLTRNRGNGNRTRGVGDPEGEQA